jgi:hypothetical protein
VIENNPNKNLIVSMRFNQGFRYPKGRKGKRGPSILISLNEGSLKELKCVALELPLGVVSLENFVLPFFVIVSSSRVSW